MRLHARHNADSATDKVVAELKSLVADAEELLRPATAEASGRTAALRAELKGRLSEAMGRAAAIESRATARARHAARGTDDYVHKNPWQTALIAAAVAFLVGLLFRGAHERRRQGMSSTISPR